MTASIPYHDAIYQVNFDAPIDISIPTIATKETAKAWYVDPIKITPVVTDRFNGSVAKGGNVNFRNIFFNPHGNTTHTECVGHITKDIYSVNQALKKFTFIAQLITIEPEIHTGPEEEFRKLGDRIITTDQIRERVSFPCEALIIRTTPNTDAKLNMQWDGTNWPFMDKKAMELLAQKKVKHLLLDLPSVDREMDGGKMLAHKAFWQHPDELRLNATITEMIYVPNTINDGLYLLNLHMASFENDASPCKPVLYAMHKNPV